MNWYFHGFSEYDIIKLLLCASTQREKELVIDIIFCNMRMPSLTSEPLLSQLLIDAEDNILVSFVENHILCRLSTFLYTTCTRESFQ